ncbi:unnamed protein product [Pleuronectes platessa]|uniref:Uncharacterized protein n=1 Tax=Pleuronectes platessa TaxID=8262 RepID=A0A9N7UMZ1_PLEPL|nr:unnamed protein product [Pleuronectes platessa]
MFRPLTPSSTPRIKNNRITQFGAQRSGPQRGSAYRARGCVGQSETPRATHSIGLNLHCSGLQGAAARVKEILHLPQTAYGRVRAGYSGKYG